jgi:hypothetical protein
MSSQKTNEFCIRIQLRDTHCEAALNSGNWCFLSVHDEGTGLNIALFLGDSRLRLNGYTDSQNKGFPTSIHEVSLLDLIFIGSCVILITEE